MPTNTASGYRGDAGLESRLRKVEDDVRQLRERATRPQKIPAAVAASGGIVGMAQLRATTGSIIWEAGSTDMQFGGVTYGTPSDPNSGGDGASTSAVSSWLSVSGYQITVDPGWYVPVLYMRILWDDPATCPPSLRGPYMNGGSDAVHGFVSIHAAADFSPGRRGIIQVANFGPTYMGAGTDFHAECQCDGGTPSADSNPALSEIYWDITKLG